MPTVITDDDEVRWNWTPPIPGFVPKTIRQHLAEPFSDDPDFVVYEGRPVVVWGMQDYAEDWSAYPIREVHPYLPLVRGTPVTEAQFRQLVRALHAIKTTRRQ